MTTTQTRTQTQTSQAPMMWALFLIGAGLLIASGAIHLHLWFIAYRHVKTLNALFLVQAIGTFVAAIVLLITRHFLIAAGCALLDGRDHRWLLARQNGRHLRLQAAVHHDRGLDSPGHRGRGGRPAAITAWLSLKQRSN